MIWRKHNRGIDDFWVLSVLEENFKTANIAVNKLMALNIDTEVILTKTSFGATDCSLFGCYWRDLLCASQLYFAPGISNCCSKVTWNRVDRQVEIQLSKLEYLLPLLNFWDACDIQKRAGSCTAQSTGDLFPFGIVAGSQAGYPSQIRYVCLGTWIAPLRLRAWKMRAKRLVSQDLIGSFWLLSSDHIENGRRLMEEQIVRVHLSTQRERATWANQRPWIALAFLFWMTFLLKYPD